MRTLSMHAALFSSINPIPPMSDARLYMTVAFWQRRGMLHALSG